MLTLALLLLAPADDRVLTPPPRIDLNTVTLAAARRLGGQAVRATLVLGCPPGFAAGRTQLGAGPGPVERVADVPETWEYDAGDAVTVEGTLRVIRHPGRAVNGVHVPAWTEVRVTGTPAR